MQLTEEQRKALVVSLERRIKNAKRWLSSNKSIGNPEGEAIELISIYEIALAALTAEPAGYTVVTGAGNTLFRKHKPRKRASNEAAIPVYTAPPVAALRLPVDGLPDVSEESYEYRTGFAMGCACYAKRVIELNAAAAEEKRE